MRILFVLFALALAPSPATFAAFIPIRARAAPALSRDRRVSGPPSGRPPPAAVSAASAAAGLLPRLAGPLAAAPRWLVRHKAQAFLAALLAYALTHFRRLVRPNSTFRPDPASALPLPPRAPSCPLLGNQILGTGGFWHRTSRALGHPRAWLYSFLGQPGVVLSGGGRLTRLLNREFDADGVSAGLKPGRILTADSLLSESDRKEHAALRRLVGAAVTPAAVAAAIPTLQAVAERQLDRMLVAEGGAVRMKEACTEYTLEVAWAQLIGLDLDEEEVPAFRRAVDAWIGGFTSLRVILDLWADGDPSITAKAYLEGLVRERIRHLEAHGPDDSTLSGMVHARDDEDGGRRLTTEQVVENSFLLILAGTETSASTLMNAVLGLGLHPTAWGRLVEEQRRLEGRPLTQKMLEKECPYLDSVVREALRIKPIPSGVPRVAKTTLEVDDLAVQIPAGWSVHWNVQLTHELDPVTYREDGSHMTLEGGFAPERWLDEATRPRDDFLPLGAGPRRCLGGTLAYAEMRVFLAVLARRAEFDLEGAYADGATPIRWKRMSIIPQAADGVPVTVRPATAGVVRPTTAMAEA